MMMEAVMTRPLIGVMIQIAVLPLAKKKANIKAFENVSLKG